MLTSVVLPEEAGRIYRPIDTMSTPGSVSSHSQAGPANSSSGSSARYASGGLARPSEVLASGVVDTRSHRTSSASTAFSPSAGSTGASGDHLENKQTGPPNQEPRPLAYSEHQQPPAHPFQPLSVGIDGWVEQDDTASVHSMHSGGDDDHTRESASIPMPNKAAAGGSFIVRQRTPPDLLLRAAAEAQQQSEVRIQHSRLQRSQYTLNWAAAAEVTFYFLFSPFSVVLIWLIRGNTAARNFGMCPRVKTFFLHIFHMAAVVEICRYMLSTNSGHLVAHPAAIAMFIGSFVAVRLWMAFQYFFLTKDQYCRLMKVQLTQEQLDDLGIANWVLLTHPRALREIDVVRSRVGVCVDKSRFLLNMSAAQRFAPCMKRESCPSNLIDSGRIPLVHVLSFILHTASRDSNMRYYPLFGIIMVAPMAYELMLLINPAGTFLVVPPYWYEALIYFAFIAVFLLQSYKVFMFLVFASLDNRRRLTSLQMYEKLFTEPDEDEMLPVDMENGNSRSANAPIVSLLVTENVHMFHMGRRLLQLVGQQFLRQWEVSTSLFGMSWVAIVLAYVFAPQSMPFYIVCHVTLFLVLPIAIATFWGARVNDLAAKDTALLLSRSTEAWEAHVSAEMFHMADLSRAFRDCERVLSLTANGIEADAKLYPVRVMGFAATDTVLRSGLVTLFSLFSLLLRVM